MFALGICTLIEGMVMMGMCHCHLKTPSHYSLFLVYLVSNYHHPILVTFGHYGLCLAYFVAPLQSLLGRWFSYSQSPEKVQPLRGGTCSTHAGGGSDRASYCEPKKKKKYTSLKLYTPKNTWHQNFLPQNFLTLLYHNIVCFTQSDFKTLIYT